MTSHLQTNRIDGTHAAALDNDTMRWTFFNEMDELLEPKGDVGRLTTKKTQVNCARCGKSTARTFSTYI
jgi:hypothetical protein